MKPHVATASVAASGDHDVKSPDAAWWGAAAATAVLWIAWHIGFLPGHTFDATRFIVYDQGSFLYAIGQWLGGQRVYADFAWQYGPLALGWYSAFAMLLGNTPLTLVIASGVAMGIAWMIWIRFATHLLGNWTGLAWGTLVLLPVMTPACLLSINTGPHAALEALLLGCVAWMLWRAVAAQCRSDNFLLGVLLGALHSVRFGPHLVAGVAVVLLLLFSAWQQRPERRVRFLPQFGLILSGYLLVAAFYALWLAGRVGWTAMLEQFWPSHMVQHFKAMNQLRWPHLSSPSDFINIAAPPLFAVMLAMYSFWAIRRRHTPARQTAAILVLMFPACYYALSMGVLFKSEYHVLAHAWVPLACLPLAMLLRRAGRLALLAFSVLLLVFHVREIGTGIRQEHAWQASPATMPNGQVLWFHGEEWSRFVKLEAYLRRYPVPLAAGEHRRLVVFAGGGGLHHFFLTERIGRHWWYLPEFVRPREYDRVAGDLASHDLLLVVTSVPSTASPVLAIWTPLPPELAQRFLGRLKNPRPLPDLGYLFEISPER